MWDLFDMFSKSIYFIRNRDNFNSSRQSFKIMWLKSGIELEKTPNFQLSISKIVPAKPKKHWDMGCE